MVNADVFVPFAGRKIDNIHYFLRIIKKRENRCFLPTRKQEIFTIYLPALKIIFIKNQKEENPLLVKQDAPDAITWVC